MDTPNRIPIEGEVMSNIHVRVRVRVCVCVCVTLEHFSQTKDYRHWPVLLTMLEKVGKEKN